MAEVIFVGVGGRGILMAGRLLAAAAAARDRHVLWYPSYASATRGGPCECTVIFSDQEVLSPLLDQAETVVVLTPSQLRSCEGRVKEHGLLMVERFGLRDKPTRNDLRLVEVPGFETARELGFGQAANLVVLGAYVHVSQALPAQLVAEEIEARFGHNERLLALNLTAFREGLKRAQSLWAPRL